jgi:hypothetical protein
LKLPSILKPYVQRSFGMRMLSFLVSSVVLFSILYFILLVASTVAYWAP